jgi:signal transduction histidine kinase
MSKSLQQKNTRYFLIWLPVVLVFGTLLFYAILAMHAHHMQGKQLELKQKNVWNAFLATREPIAAHITGEYDLAAWSSGAADTAGEPRDTSVYYPADKKWVAFKILTNQYWLNGAPFRLTTYVSSREITHLIIKVLLTEAFVFLLVLGAIAVINRKASGLLWQPFYATMEKVNEYDIIKNQSLQLAEQTGTSEFDQLNRVLTNLISGVNRAYTNQKQFVENASHELQTPLAIIRSKLDLLINAEDLTEDTAGLLAAITEASERLSQMNRNLLLLAKIDNNQYPKQTDIDLSATIEKLLVYYQGSHEENLPVIKKSIQSGVHLLVNTSLIEILISNLINNAIVHNIPNGYVDISLRTDELVIENTGHPIEGETERLFERFKKGRVESKTTGLGLALVKQICQLYQFDLQYDYKGNIHRVRVNFGRGPVS